MSDQVAPCRACGFVLAGLDWGFLGDRFPFGECAHVTGERNCDSCSRRWYRVGNDNTHDYDLVGDPPRYVGGPASEDCPECAADALPQPRAFIGLKSFSGWQFTLTPAANEAGSPGFTRETLVASTASFDGLAGSCEYYERLDPGYTERCRKALEHPASDWVEERWLTEWLKAGLIKEATT